MAVGGARSRVVVLVAVAGILLAGCGDGDELSPEAEWADGVCSAWDDLTGEVDALRDSLELDSSNESASPGQVLSNVEEQLRELADSASDLGSAITDTPDNVDEVVDSAREDLSASADAVQQSIGMAADAFAAVTAATTPQEISSAVADATTALTAVGQALSGLGSDVESNASATADALRQAFDEAPSCQERTSSPELR